jgi:hypothetical protein
MDAQGRNPRTQALRYATVPSWLFVILTSDASVPWY